MQVPFAAALMLMLVAVTAVGAVVGAVVGVLPAAAGVLRTWTQTPTTTSTALARTVSVIRVALV